MVQAAAPAGGPAANARGSQSGAVYELGAPFSLDALSLPVTSVNGMVSMLGGHGKTASPENSVLTPAGGVRSRARGGGGGGSRSDCRQALLLFPAPQKVTRVTRSRSGR